MTALRTGLTTGTCAAAAAKAAARVLCGLEGPEQIDVRLPDGSRVTVPVLYARESRQGSMAAVRKDAGDDPDVTDGMDVVVSLWFVEGDEITFLAGEGIGTVTKPGLQITPGQPAVNPVPRRMIADAIAEVTDRAVCVEISIPGGRAAAEKTFNPRLGIVGGLSVLGTTGIVRPYCAKALHDAIRCALDVAAACDISAPILVPGNIGAKAAERHFTPASQQTVEVANAWGVAVDELAKRPFQAVLLLGHPGKLAKLIAGDWDTHSSRSTQAVGLVAQIAREIGHEPSSDSETVEGLFQSLASDQRTRLGNEVASRIGQAVSRRIEAAMPVTLFLVNMAGECLGTDGDLTPWQ